jgi:Na+-translocating ferredoxin:NAD+ oxidoreductase subunit D
MADKESSPLMKLSSAPHIRTGDSVTVIMWTVVIALMPAAAYSVYLNGLRALILMAAAIAAAVAAEAGSQYLLKRKLSFQDGSAAITGLLVAMNVPPGAPVWLVVVGSFFAIIIVKQLFGGLDSTSSIRHWRPGHS